MLKVAPAANDPAPAKMSRRLITLSVWCHAAARFSGTTDEARLKVERLLPIDITAPEASLLMLTEDREEGARNQ
jgi:hypothetical protein